MYSKRWGICLFGGLIGLVGGTACGDVANDVYEELTADSAPPVTALDSAAIGEGTGDPSGGFAQLGEIEGSGVTGEIEVSGAAARTLVLVRLTGAARDANYAGHIHRGTCPAIGMVAHPLRPVVTDSTGSGSVTTELDVTASTVMDGQHIVVYHGTGGRPITCASIPAPSM